MPPHDAPAGAVPQVPGGAAVGHAPSAHPVHPGIRSPRPADERAARANAQLLPTLFDRLRDDAPSRASESPADYTATPARMRDLVQRDLAYLLNTTNAEDLIDRNRYPEAAASTVNFGVPPLAGSYMAGRKWEDIERIVRGAILAYEPRLLPETVMVLPLMKEGAQEPYNVLLFEIRAMVDLKPYPLELTVQSSVDLETSRMRITRASRSPRRTLR